MKRSILSLVFLAAIAFPAYSHAQVPFGGLDVFEIPCTCSPFTFHVFTPLYVASPIPITGALAASYTPNLWMYYILHPGAWALGYFVPAAEACWMYAVAGCFPLPTLGTISPFTGTSP